MGTPRELIRLCAKMMIVYEEAHHLLEAYEDTMKGQGWQGHATEVRFQVARAQRESRTVQRWMERWQRQLDTRSGPL